MLADALPMRGRMIHPVDGPLDFQPYSADGDAGDQLDQPRRRSTTRCSTRPRPHPACRCASSTGWSSSTRRPARLTFETPNGQVIGGGAAIVLGADGAGSAVRGRLLAERAA